MIDITGQRFGRLIALYPTEKRGHTHVIWCCKCDCGNFIETRSNRLRGGDTKSCGCLQKEMAADQLSKVRKVHFDYKHGDTRRAKRPVRLYRIWVQMKARCYDPNHNRYRWYGAKGVKVCEEWRNDYRVFKFWAILNGYQENLTIDRIDNDGNYEPSNCQFLTKSENIKKAWKTRNQN